MDNDRYRLGYHIAPKEGWLNDPNGLCQFRGTYYVYFQYNPYWPERDTKHWRLFVSSDLVHWHDEGTKLVTDIDEDRSGVYSGSALVRRGSASDGGDLMCLYYTGNVIYPNDADASLDYVHTGREANEILVTSEDGKDYSRKRVLLRNADYPDVCTLHVRDPKVWEQDGRTYMLLGARDLDDEGFALLYGSDDGMTWHIESQIYSRRPFGFMWECPNIVQLGGRDFLAACPQGLPTEAHRWQNLWQAGYFPLEGSILSTELVDETNFVEWDHGYDFYAPQVFVDDAGRTILLGWMGTFDPVYTSTPHELAWCHCLTVPRELTLGEDGLLRQWPVRELETLREESADLMEEPVVVLDDHRADIVLEGIEGEGAIVLDGGLEFAYEDGMLLVYFDEERLGAGRLAREVPLDNLSDLRVLIDTSSIEIFANGGEWVFSTRWFPVEDELSIRSSFEARSAVVWSMENAMAGAFD